MRIFRIDFFQAKVSYLGDLWNLYRFESAIWD